MNAPDGYEEKLGELPENVAVAKKPAGQYDVIQVFVRSRKELEDHLPVKSALKPKGILWVTYPQGTSKELKADINRESIREQASTIGLQAAAIFSVDEDWSALRLKLT